MRKKKNLMPKIMASIALLAIIAGIVGTGILVIVSSFSDPYEEAISQEELQEYIQTLSGSLTSTGSQEADTQLQ